MRTSQPRHIFGTAIVAAALILLGLVLAPSMVGAVLTSEPTPQPQDSSATSSFDVSSVQIQDRAGSPLSIEVETVSAADPASPEITLVLTNTTAKPIHAYTLQYYAMGRFIKTGGLTLHSFVDRDQLFTPGQSQHYQIEQIQAEEPIERVIVLLDYVEFADRTSWGTDSNKSREKLEGMRAGGRAVQKELQRTLSTSGVDGVDLVLHGERGVDGLELAVQKSRSAAWQSGFRTGANAMWQRTLRGLKPGASAAEIEVNLDLPYNLSGQER